MSATRPTKAAAGIIPSSPRLTRRSGRVRPRARPVASRMAATSPGMTCEAWRSRLATAALAVVVLTAPVAAAAALTGADRADVARVEAYLNGIRTLSSRFLQVSSSGGYSEGTFDLSRPGRLRIEYDPPVPILMVADGRQLVYYDRKLKQVSYMGLDSSPVGILLADTISLSKKITVTEIERSPGAIRVGLVKTEDPNAGRLTLVFADSPLQLRKWVVEDAQGATTTVSLLSPRTDVKLDPKLFRFEDPNLFDQHRD